MKILRHLKALPVFALLLVALNFHMPNLGGSFVSRNLLAWMVMAIAIAVLFWPALRSSRLKWSPLWVGGLFAPVAGAFIIVALNILGPFDSYHAGHFMVPCLLLAFALFMLGLLQKPLRAELAANLILLLLFGFLPQYFIHFVTTNPLVFFKISISLPSFLVQNFGGFAQYNLFGTFLVALLLMAAWAFIFAPLARWQRGLLIVLITFYALEFAVMRSKTGLLSALLGFSFLALHVHRLEKDPALYRRFAWLLGVLALTYALVWAMYYANPERQLVQPDWSSDGSSVRSRYAMWVIAWRSFLEAPLLGHGLGSFATTYIDHFSSYGLAEALTFTNNTMLPHNLILHVLTETGLLGAAVLLAPLAYLAWFLLLRNPNLWLIAALCTPVLLHTQVEFPYVASGWHYLLLGFGLVVGLQGSRMPDRVAIAASPKHVFFSFAGFGFLLVFCFGMIFVSSNMLQAANRIVHKVDAASRLSLDDYIDQRYRDSDTTHPVLVKQVTAITDLVLVSRAITEGRVNVLRQLAIPRLEKHVLPLYTKRKVWDLAIRAYAATHNVAGIEALIERVAPLQPWVADEYREALDEALAAKPNHTPNPLPRQ